jgi:hypothetical protein
MSSSAHMDVDDRIASSGCEKQYRTLEDCIIESDRDWRRCQTEVTVLRQCMESKSVSVGFGKFLADTPNDTKK